MNVQGVEPWPWRKRTDVRLLAFGLSAVLAVYTGFIGMPVHLAGAWVKHGGYFVMLVTVALFVASLRSLRGRPIFQHPLCAGERWAAILVIGLLSLIAITAEPYCSKVLNDEFVLQSTAFNMHFYRDVATMVRGYEIGGTFASLDNYLDKRPYFYPFLVSLAHDLTGYRASNAFWINSALMPVGLGVAFAFGRLLRGWSGGMLAVLLLGSLPLFGQNATGSGMEMTNIVLLLTAMFLAALYIERPDDVRLGAFLMSIVLLSQSRYESALYVLAGAGIVLTVWVRTQVIGLPWITVLLPWLLLPVALQNKVLSHSPILWELTESASTRFDTAYFPANLRGAFRFLFNSSPLHANSLILSVLGLLGLAWILWRVCQRVRIRTGSASSPALALAAFGVVIIANTILVFCYYWSRFDDPIAARFSLPLHVLLTFAAVVLVTAFNRWPPISRLAFVMVGIGSVASATGRIGYHLYSHLGVAEVEWQKRYVDALPIGQRLVVTNQSTVPWLLRKTPSILVGRARLVADRLQHQLREPMFNEILVMQTLRPSTADGDHQVVPSDILPEFFRLQFLAEKRFGTRISRISRLVAVDLPPDWAPMNAGAGAKPGE